MATPCLVIVAEMMALTQVNGVVVIFAIVRVVAKRFHANLVALLSHALFEVSSANDKRNSLKFVNPCWNSILSR